MAIGPFRAELLSLFHVGLRFFGRVVGLSGSLPSNVQGMCRPQGLNFYNCVLSGPVGSLPFCQEGRSLNQGIREGVTVHLPFPYPDF